MAGDNEFEADVPPSIAERLDRLHVVQEGGGDSEPSPQLHFGHWAAAIPVLFVVALGLALVGALLLSPPPSRSSQTGPISPSVAQVGAQAGFKPHVGGRVQGSV